MGLVSIGEFAGLSRLSPKALRLYDELGLLVPAEVGSSPGASAVMVCGSGQSATGG